MRIRTNFIALKTKRHLTKSASEVGDAAVRLSSGKRIVKSSDDAAGSSISKRIESGVRSKQTAQRNANDAVAILQVAQGTASVIQGNLIRMRELTVKALDGTLNDSHRNLIDYEIHQLKEEIQRTSETAKVNGRKLLDGKTGVIEIQVDKGNSKDDRIKIRWDDLAHGAEALGIFDISVKSITRAQLALQKIDYAMKEVSKGLAEMGANQSRLSSAANKLTTDNINLETAKSKIVDADVAVETSKITKENIKKHASMNILSNSHVRGDDVLKLLE